MSPGSHLRAIVGIGASAGGLDAITGLLHALPADTGMAFVFVQHLDPRHESVLPELLSGRTRMPVVHAQEGVTVQPDHVYVIPPNATLAISGGVLHLTPRAEAGERHLPIDDFLSSLARDQRAGSIGVILSGAASDGTGGLRAIKAEGGITFAQDDSAAFDSMPHSAISAGVVDFVLPPAGIAAELTAIGQHPYHAGPQDPEGAFTDHAWIHKLHVLLRKTTGVDFSQYRQATVQRRVMRRMVLQRATDLGQYLDLVRRTPAEAQALFEDLLINVTEFFRDPETFEALQERAFPHMLKERERGQPIRMWVPGCASGEEVYSIAISLFEYLEAGGLEHPVQIFGTDLSEAAIEKARAGVYPEAAVSSVRADRLRRFFTRVGTGYQISRAIREMCIFSLQDVTRDPPLSRMDLISCRNLLIYLGPALQSRTLGVFLYALQPDGCLLLGPSETPGDKAGSFVSLDREHRIYFRPRAVLRQPFDLPAHLVPVAPITPLERSATPPPGAPDSPIPGLVRRYVEQFLLSRYAPCGLVVDDRLKVVEFLGEVGPYLVPAAGEVGFDLHQVVREDLALHLRAALEEARAKEAGIRLEGIEVRESGRLRRLDLAVLPLSIPSFERHFLVLFEEVAAGGPVAPRGEAVAPAEPPAAPETEARIAHLEAELAATRHYFQTIIEELRTANEEAQSSNEELQSTNEELQTAKEELQSTNEELTTMNAEIESRNRDLDQANNDLVNLLGSLNVPIMMLNRELQIRRFTPACEKVLTLVPGDIGRSISDFKLRIDVPNLEQILRHMIETLTPYEQEVRDFEGRWYSLRGRPYRTTDDRIQGAVVQFLDVNEIKVALEDARRARDYAEAVVGTVREPLIVLDDDCRVESVNRSFQRVFQLPSEQVTGRSIYEIGGGCWDRPPVRGLLANTRASAGPVRDVEVVCEFPGVGAMTMLLSARRIELPGGSARVLLAVEDITDRKRAEEARFRRLFEAAKDGMLIVDARTHVITDVNPQAEQLFGCARAELVGSPVWDAGPLKGVPEIRDGLARIGEQGVIRFPELAMPGRDGRTLQVETIASAYDEGDRRMVQFNLRDITERKRFERQLEHTQRLESLGLLAGGIAHDFNNLLTGVLGNASLLLAEAEGDGPSRTILQRIVRAAERASDLTRQMLAYAGKGQLSTRPVDVNRLVRDISELVRSSLPRTVAIETELADGLPLVEGDPGQLQQLVMNLVINGGEAIPPDRLGVVVVRTSVREFTATQAHEYLEAEHLEPGRHVVLEVTDNGTGIDDTIKARIFDPFFTTKFTGRGLGLAAARGIVQGHRGAMRLYSTPGRGTSFEILLRASAAIAGEATAMATSSRPDGGTVLFVDDEDTVRMVAKEALERRGFQVILAGDGEEGVRIFHERHADIALIVLDSAMPVMSGQEALGLLRQIEPAVPIVLSSGFDRAQAFKPVAGYEPAGFIMKPYTADALLQAVRSALSAGDSQVGP